MSLLPRPNHRLQSLLSLLIHRLARGLSSLVLRFRSIELESPSASIAINQPPNTSSTTAMNVLNVINRAQRLLLGHSPLQASASAPTTLNRSIPSNASGITTSTTGGPVSILRRPTRDLDDAAAAVANHRACFDGYVRLQLLPPGWNYPKTPTCTICYKEYDSKTMMPTCGCDRFNLHEIQGCRVVHVTEPKSSSYRSAPVCFDRYVQVKEIDLVGYCKECDKGHHSCKCWTAQYSFGRDENEFLASYVDSRSSISSDVPPEPIWTRVLKYCADPNDTSEEPVESDAVKAKRAANKRLAEKTKWPAKSVFDQLSESNVSAPEVSICRMAHLQFWSNSPLTSCTTLLRLFHSSCIPSSKKLHLRYILSRPSQCQSRLLLKL